MAAVPLVLLVAGAVVAVAVWVVVAVVDMVVRKWVSIG